MEKNQLAPQHAWPSQRRSQWLYMPTCTEFSLGHFSGWSRSTQSRGEPQGWGSILPPQCLVEPGPIQPAPQIPAAAVQPRPEAPWHLPLQPHLQCTDRGGTFRRVGFPAIQRPNPQNRPLLLAAHPDLWPQLCSRPAPEEARSLSPCCAWIFPVRCRVAGPYCFRRPCRKLPTQSSTAHQILRALQREQAPPVEPLAEPLRLAPLESCVQHEEEALVLPRSPAPGMGAVHIWGEKSRRRVA